AIAGIGHAENLHVLNFWMAIEEFLDLARIQVLAAADHHVLDAADDVAIALVIDGGEVAGVHPAIGVENIGGLFLLLPITEHDAVAAGAELAAFAALDDLAVEIDDLDLDMRMDASNCGDAPLERIVDGALEADGAGLGHAVSDGDLAHVHFAV